eukprot:1141242-Pelagomonas_calceolata.AAC.3
MEPSQGCRMRIFGKRPFNLQALPHLYWHKGVGQKCLYCWIGDVHALIALEAKPGSLDIVRASKHCVHRLHPRVSDAKMVKSEGF